MQKTECSSDMVEHLFRQLCFTSQNTLAIHLSVKSSGELVNLNISMMEKKLQHLCMVRVLSKEKEKLLEEINKQTNKLKQ